MRDNDADLRWVLVEFPPRAGGYQRDEAPALLGPALSRAVRFFDVATDPAFAPAGNGLPMVLGADIGFELRLANAAVLSLRMSDAEIEDAPPGVIIRNDSPTRAVGLAFGGSTSEGTAENEVPIATVKRIGATRAWERTKGSGAKAAILDSGVNSAHPDLGGIHGITFVPETTPEDRYGHGTRCAGVLAARLNGSGLIGVAPDMDLLSLKVIDDFGSGWGGWLAAAAFWCAVYGTRVASVSVRLEETVPTLEWLFDVISSAVLVVAAAGNRASDEPTAVVAPACYPGVMAVSGVDENLRLADFSRFGTEIDIAAPATSVRTTSGASGYKTCQGTSLACPHVAGTAALVFALRPAADPRWVGHRLLVTAQRIGSSTSEAFGSGLVNADGATA
jgi:subtilisin family serine protease